MTTVLGALMGRALGVPVAHVESGLRSFDLRHPFPEELDRRVVSRLAHLHYAPGPWAAANLSRGAIVDTGCNTIRDSLALCPDGEPAGVALPPTAFGVVSLHRFELLNDRRLFTDTLRLLAEHARQTPLLFVEHPVTVAAVERYGLEDVFGAGLRRMRRLVFRDFVSVVRRCAFLVTDSGGSQEEAYYLDIPCAVHRSRTERQEGLGENVLLTNYDLDLLRRFLANPGAYRRQRSLPAASPSDVIVDDLEKRGFVA
jgi:UDP-N-acetylglucosamine 2-epimerase (non-hydrolysing)